MGNLLSGFGFKKTVAVLDLTSGDFRKVNRFPFLLAASGNAAWKLSGWDRSVGCSIVKDGSRILLTPHAEDHTNLPMLNDRPFSNQIEIQDGEIYTLKIATNLLAIGRVAKPEAWAESVQTSSWVVFNGQTEHVLGTAPLNQIGVLIAQANENPAECLAIPAGLETSAFWVGHLQEWMGQEESATDLAGHSAPISPPPLPSDAIQAQVEQENINVGDFTCPICWLKFDGKEIKHIAAHPELKGDEKLGPDEMQRFVPVKFDDNGDPLDSLGQLCPDIACPHCHQRLPVGFTAMKPHIFSIVGAPSSGKSYYLAILINQLKKSMFRLFEIGFGDLDPEYNIQLNAVINQLFAASNAARGAIQKTQMRGDNYRQVKRAGREVDLPKPYFYTCSRIGVEGSEKSFVFYDNAGEHFLPQNARAADFHIEHVARASALFFLFDPVSNIEFKRQIDNDDNVQLNLPEYEPDNQDVILAQMDVRIKRLLSRPFTEKLEVPLAVLINKCDLWNRLMADWPKLKNPLEKDCLNLETLDRNSLMVKKFMEEMSPSIVATAERISNEVRYFPVSAFGHRPASYVDPVSGETMIAPAPKQIKPMMVDVPTIWAMSKISSGFFPIKEPAAP